MTSDDWDSFAAAARGTHPPLDSPGVPLDGAAPPDPPARAPRPGEGRRRPSSPGRCSGDGAVTAGRRRPDDRPGRRGRRPAHHRHRPAARRRRPADPGVARRDLAGQRVGPLPPPRRPVAGHARPQLHRRPAATLTDADGTYRFTTIKPGAYPWGNHPNAWRPAHIHFSVFGRAFTQRLVTQMYFPDDPLFFQDPILNAVPDPARPPAARRPLRPRRHRAGVGARVPLRRRRARPGGARRSRTAPMADRPGPHAVADGRAVPPPRARRPGARARRRRRRPGAVTISGTVVDGDGDPVPDAVVETWQIDGRFTRCPTGARRRLGGAHGQAAAVADAATAPPQAPHLVVSVFARGPARPRRHAPLLRRRGRGQRRRPDARRRSMPTAATCSSPSRPGPAGTVSTSACRVTMSPSSSRSDRPVRVPRRPRPGRRGDVGDGVGAGDARRRGRAGRRPGRRRRHPRRRPPRRSPRRATSTGSTSTRSSTRPRSAATPSSRSCPRLRELVGPDARRARPPRRDEPGHRRRGDRRSSCGAAPSSSATGLLTASQAAADARRDARRRAPMISRTLGQYAVPTTFAHGRRPVGRRAGRGVGRRRPHGAACRSGSAGRAATARPSARRGAEIAERFADRARRSTPAPVGRHTQRNGARRPSPARGDSPRRRSPRSPSTSCCSPQATSASSPSGPTAPAGRRRCRTSTTRSPRSAPGRRRCRCPASWRRCCTPPAATSWSGPPAPGTPSGRRSTSCCGRRARRSTGCGRSLERLVVDPDRMAANLARSERA